MKRLSIIVLTCSLIGWVGCITDDKPTTVPYAAGGPEAIEHDPNSLTSIQWIDSIQNPGSVLEGQKVDVVFRFKNVGDKPLVIESAEPSCGCTVPAKPDKPIMPGQMGEIKAVFNSEGRRGTNHKTITVQANTKPSTTHVVMFNVDVLGKDEGPRAANASSGQFQ